MTEQDESLRSSHASGKLDEIAVSVLHDSGPDHSCIPSPLDEHIRQDHVLDIDAEKRNHRKYHNLTWEGEHNVDRPHDDLLRDSAEISRQKSHKSSKTDGSKHRQDCQPQCRADPIDHSRKNAAAEVVRSKRIFSRKSGKFVEDIRFIRIVWRNKRGEDPHERCEENDRHGERCSPVM